MNRSGRLAVLVVLALALTAPAAEATNDPQFAAQNVAGGALQRLRIESALTKLGKPLVDVPVAVLDTGADTSHPDLRFWSNPTAVAAPSVYGQDEGIVPAGAKGWDLLGGAPVYDDALGPGHRTPDADPDDTNGHGTAVSGIFAAIRNNGIQIAGIAPNARLMAMRSCWPADGCFQGIQAAAANWAADRGAKVVSMSWMDSDLANFETSLRQAIDNHPGMLFVAVASNDANGNQVQPSLEMPCAYPAAHDNVLCVTALSASNVLCGQWHATKVDVAAVPSPGLSTNLAGGFSGTGCSTSEAAPVAAGLAAILFGLRPTSTAAEVKKAIIDSARPNAALAGKVVSGGELDADAAVTLFQQRFGIALPPGDSDGDGIPNASDHCPGTKGVASADPLKNGCPATTPPKDKTKPKVTVTTGKLPSITSFRRDGLKFAATISEKAALAATFTVGSSTKSKLGLKSRTLATGTSSVPKAGKKNIRLKVSKSTAKKLKAAKSLKITITVAAIDPAKNAGASKLVVKLK